jgi:hypothetical protein
MHAKIIIISFEIEINKNPLPFFFIFFNLRVCCPEDALEAS